MYKTLLLPQSQTVYIKWELTLTSFFFADPPDGGESWTFQKGRLNFATDLVKLIRQEHGDYFSICVAGITLYLGLQYLNLLRYSPVIYC